MEAAPCLVRCPDCQESRLVRGLTAAVLEDAAAQGLGLPCLLTPSCTGSMVRLPPPAPVQDLPPARGGRHVGPCPACQVPLLYDYLYGYAQGLDAAHCPRCGHDLTAWAWQVWPRAADGAHAMDIKANLVAAVRAPERIEVREVSPLLRTA